jgi:spore coat protein U-like protein
MSIKSRLLFLSAATVVCLGATNAANAVSANMNVTASVSENCTISNVNDLALGSYDPIGANNSADLATGQATFDLTCTLGATPTIAISMGQHEDSGQRRAMQGSDFLSYNLYSDSNRSSAWDTANTVDGTGDVTGNAHTYTVYAVVPGGQNVPSGSYSDTVSIDVTF